MFRILAQAFFWCVGGFLFISQNVAQIINTNDEKAITFQLLSDKAEIALINQAASGGDLLIGVQINAEKGWHYYWAGIGTEFLEPTVSWELPGGYQIEAVNHPEPRLFDYNGIKGYGYDGKTVFLYRLSKDHDSVNKYSLEDKLELSVKIDWISCNDVCLIGSKELFGAWPLAKTDKASASSEYLNSLLDDEVFKKNQNLENYFLEMGIWGWVTAALLGGVILNLMPCVLPVLSIKILSLIDYSGGDYSKRFIHGLIYSLGVVSSFIILAIILMGLRSLGEEVGWGFQLQDPYFITFLIILFFLLGLNMLGLFEIGTSFTSFSNTSLSNRSDWVGSFFSGVLAAVVGAPCVGPFIGGVSGIALQVNAGLGIMIFALIGLGMALPFFLLSCAPALIRLFPKPGKWMVKMRKAMGVLLILSTAFLLWVVDQSVGFNGVAPILIALGFTFFASYIIGRWGRVSESKKKQLSAKLVGLFMILAAGFLGSHYLAKLYNNDFTETFAIQEGTMEKWSEESVRHALDSGHGVFIDFTASWCLICQSNKVFVLKKEKTQTLFRKYGIRTFIADWTLKDPDITRALDSYGRSGVPLYILKSPDGTNQILPQNLTYSHLEGVVEAMFSEE